MLNKEVIVLKIIYSIECKCNACKYIGCTYDLSKRKSEHLNELKRNRHYNSSLRDDFNKFGIDNFTFQILESDVSDESCSDREDFWINLYGGINSSYVYNNMTSYAKSDHMKQQLSRWYKGKTHYETYGKERADKMRQLNSEKHKGRVPAVIPYKGKVKMTTGQMVLVTPEMYNLVKALRLENKTYKQISQITNIGENGVRNIIVDAIYLSWKCND